MHNQVRKSVLLVSLLGIAGVSQAAMDLAPITAAADVGTISVAIIAMGALMMAPNVAKWAAKKLANFF